MPTNPDVFLREQRQRLRAMEREAAPPEDGTEELRFLLACCLERQRRRKEERTEDHIWRAIEVIRQEFAFAGDWETGIARMQTWMEARRTAAEIEDAWAEREEEPDE